MKARIVLVLNALSACALNPRPAPVVDATPVTPEIEIMYRSRDGAAAVCVPNDASVPLVVPPQGGLVMLVGVRTKGFELSSLDITASLRDTVDDQVLSVEQRPVTLVHDAEGWDAPAMPADLTNWANLPTCPLASATRDLFDQPYLLRLAVTDGTGAKAESSVVIVPACADGTDGDLCRCQCTHGYRLGDPCP